MKKTPTSVPGIGIRFERDFDVVMLDEKLEEEVLAISGLVVLVCSKVDFDVEILDEGLREGVLVIPKLMVLFWSEFEGEVIIEITVLESVELSVGVTVTLLTEMIDGDDSRGFGALFGDRCLQHASFCMRNRYTKTSGRNTSITGAKYQFEEYKSFHATARCCYV